MARVAFIEDHGAIRAGLALLLEQEGHVIVGAAATVAHGERLLRDERIDVAVVDIGLPDGSGADLVARWVERRPETSFLIYSGLEESSVFLEALEVGGSGIALKGGAPEEFLAAVATVAEGGTYFDPRLAQRLRHDERAEGLLRPRELEVLTLIAAGLTTQDIADRLILSPETIRTHVRHLLRRLGAKTRAHAVARGIETGHLDPSQLGRAPRD